MFHDILSGEGTTDGSAPSSAVSSLEALLGSASILDMKDDCDMLMLKNREIEKLDSNLKKKKTVLFFSFSLFHIHCMYDDFHFPRPPALPRLFLTCTSLVRRTGAPLDAAYHPPIPAVLWRPAHGRGVEYHSGWRRIRRPQAQAQEEEGQEATGEGAVQVHRVHRSFISCLSCLVSTRFFCVC